MYEYAPGITGEVRLSRQDGGYYVVLFDQDKRSAEQGSGEPRRRRARQPGSSLKI
jgi:hypothetical protein